MDIYTTGVRSLEVFRHLLSKIVAEPPTTIMLRHQEGELAGGRLSLGYGLTLVTQGCRHYGFSTPDGEERINLESGQCLFKCPNTWFRPIHDCDFQYLDIGIGPNVTSFYLNGRVNGVFGPPSYYYHIMKPAHVSIFLLAKALESISRGGMTGVLVSATTHALLAAARQELDRDDTGDGTTKHPGHNRWLTICRYLEENSHSAITRETVAKEFSMHPTHLSRLFRKEGDVCFNTYLNQIRLDNAVQMLRGRKLTIRAIAQECGFSSAGYFIRVFRKHYGVSPTRYSNEK